MKTNIMEWAGGNERASLRVLATRFFPCNLSLLLSVSAPGFFQSKTVRVNDVLGSLSDVFP